MYLTGRFDLCDDHNIVWKIDFAHSGPSSKPEMYERSASSGSRPALAKIVTKSGKLSESGRGKAMSASNFFNVRKVAVYDLRRATVAPGRKFVGVTHRMRRTVRQIDQAKQFMSQST